MAISLFTGPRTFYGAPAIVRLEVRNAVIFISAPLQGSDIAKNPIGREPTPSFL